MGKEGSAVGRAGTGELQVGTAGLRYGGRRAGDIKKYISTGRVAAAM